MINILIVTQQKPTGLTYHRQTVPNLHLERSYEGYKINYTYDISEATRKELQNYQIISFLRIVDHKFQSEEIIQRCKDAGCKVVIDIDDYWHLHHKHELKKVYEENKIAEQTVAGLKNADWITVTTNHFADKIKEFNKNVTVLPNSIDENEAQFKVNKTESERIRFSYIAGVYHSTDARLMFEGMKGVHRTMNSKKFQLCLGGYSPNQAYQFIEFMFTNEYKSLSKKYREYLSKNIEQGNEAADSEAYKRLWGKSVFEYATLYNHTDVSLVPLVENNFNSYKSQIKIIEAGWFKNAAIVSNVCPYTIDCNKSNSMLVSPSKRNEGWGVAMKSLILNPNKGKDLAESLHELVKEKYTMNVVNVTRNELYKRLCE